MDRPWIFSVTVEELDNKNIRSKDGEELVVHATLLTKFNEYEDVGSVNFSVHPASS